MSNMERLTRNLHLIYVLTEEMNKEYITDKIKKLTDKVGKYEDLEEEIGCPLEIRCNICDNSVIYDQFGKKWLIRSVFSDTFVAYDYDLYNSKYEPRIRRELFYWKEYKQTWWLKLDRSK